MHKHLPNQSCVGSCGQTLTKHVSKTPVFVRILIRTKLPLLASPYGCVKASPYFNEVGCQHLDKSENFNLVGLHFCHLNIGGILALRMHCALLLRLCSP